MKLYFISIGGYAPGELWERHVYALYPGRSAAEVKRRARQELLPGRESAHCDDLYQIDEALEVRTAGNWHTHPEYDPGAAEPVVTNGCFPIPRRTIDRWRRLRSGA